MKLKKPVWESGKLNADQFMFMSYIGASIICGFNVARGGDLVWFWVVMLAWGVLSAAKLGYLLHKDSRGPHPLGDEQDADPTPDDRRDLS